ncbi:MAG: hypothetical protein ACI9HK_001696, partial [Pirellulaceae bacterium]
WRDRFSPTSISDNLKRLKFIISKALVRTQAALGYIAMPALPSHFPHSPYAPSRLPQTNAVSLIETQPQKSAANMKQL